MMNCELSLNSISYMFVFLVLVGGRKISIAYFDIWVLYSSESIYEFLVICYDVTNSVTS